ncbi:UDP-N-acetylmuramoyl-L-alanine--D-glutamate ligase [Oceanithermus sp.]
MTLVFGLGRSGLAALRFLARRDQKACFYDDDPKPEEVEKARTLGFSFCNPGEVEAKTVVAAPGVPLDHPLLVELEKRGAEIIGEVELAWRWSKLPLVGVTGTAGKTTTTVFTAELLEMHGIRATAAGNIDPPLTAVVDDPGLQVAVVELSSFQLERTRHFRPRVAVLLNLGTDHLDRHGSLENYHAAKLRLLANLTPADYLVYNAADPRVAAAAKKTKARPLPFTPAGDPRASNARAAALAAAAMAAVLGYELDPEILEAEASRLPPVPGRFEKIGRIGEVVVIDDSIATRTDSVAAALKAAPAPVAWIVGGVDKGADTAPLLPLVRERVGLVLAVGRDGPRFAKAFASHAKVVRIDETDGEEALTKAVRLAVAEPKIRSLLLAPLAASFDQFSDYKERSRVFRNVAAKVGGEEWTPS